MKVGCVKEIKNNEFRVGMTPDNVKIYAGAGHEVYIEKGAGLGSGFTDAEYEAAGARIVVVTDKPSALLAEYASVLLTVPVDSNNFFNSMVGPQFVAEALLDTISHKVRGVEKRLKKIDRYLEELGTY